LGPELDPTAAALDADGTVTTRRGLPAWAGVATADRALVVRGDDDPTGCLRATLGGLFGGVQSFSRSRRRLRTGDAAAARGETNA
jgi:hypothetical protein